MTASIRTGRPIEESILEDLLKTHVRSLQDLAPDAQHSHASLIVLSGPETGRSKRLERGTTAIGRARDSDLVLEEEGVSRKHAEITLLPDGSVWIRDSGSTNGILVNGTALSQPQRLHDRDRIQIGTSAILKLSFQDPLETRFQERLYASAVRDPLTGLFNKRYFDERTRQELSYSKRHEVPYSVLFFDLDRFKQINDRYGHDAGDEVLRAISRAIVRDVRSEEVLARIGGEEFALSMLGSTQDAAVRCGERMRRTIEELEIEHGGSRITVTASFGVACTDCDFAVSPRELLCQADQRLYAAKRDGRNRVVGPLDSR